MAVSVSKSPTASPPAKHHYIPEFYLRWWAGADGRLERYDRPWGDKIVARRVYPSEVGFERDLYRSAGESERNQNWLETRLFQNVDNAAAQVLAKLNAYDPVALSDEEITCWSIFVRSLHHRTPARLEDFRKSGQRQWLVALDEAKSEYSRLKGATDPETFDEYRALHSQEAVDSLVLRVMPSILFSERVGTFLNSMHKHWFDVPDDAPKLLISDAMLAMTNGLQIDDGHYALPLSPSRLLLATYRRETIEKVISAGVRQLIKNMNVWTVERAKHFVGAIDRSQDRFIRNRFGRHL